MGAIRCGRSLLEVIGAALLALDPAQRRTHTLRNQSDCGFRRMRYCAFNQSRRIQLTAASAATPAAQMATIHDSLCHHGDEGIINDNRARRLCREIPSTPTSCTR